jgi:hypothetical protein
MATEFLSDEKKGKVYKLENKDTTKHPPGTASEPPSALASLQQQVGNRAVQRLLAQRSGGDNTSPFELDDETATRINRERSGGQTLDSGVQAQMADTTGHDFSEVKVHTSPESDQLNRQIGAKAFTTGQDVFFRDGAYQPNSSSGQELIAHELTHVVQQSSGAVGGSGGMMVNAPGDAFEQEADAVAKAAMSPGAAAEVQRQEEEEELQMKEDPTVQRQEMEEEEEQV